MIDCSNLKRGFYWVRFSWGWEPARWDGDGEWLRTGIERNWSEYVLEVGARLEPPA